MKPVMSGFSRASMAGALDNRLNEQSGMGPKIHPREQEADALLV
jgi:hypothetical protein